MSNKQFNIELPAYWSSALINNDWKGIEGNIHEGELLGWIEDNPKACITSCSDNNYVGQYAGAVCDMLTYEGHYIA